MIYILFFIVFVCFVALRPKSTAMVIAGHNIHDIFLNYPCRDQNIWKLLIYIFFFIVFVCFVALRPKSTAMVIAGRSVHLTTLFS